MRRGRGTTSGGRARGRGIIIPAMALGRGGPSSRGCKTYTARTSRGTVSLCMRRSSAVPGAVPLPQAMEAPGGGPAIRLDMIAGETVEAPANEVLGDRPRWTRRGLATPSPAALDVVEAILVRSRCLPGWVDDHRSNAASGHDCTTMLGTRSCRLRLGVSGGSHEAPGSRVVTLAAAAAPRVMDKHCLAFPRHWGRARRL